MKLNELAKKVHPTPGFVAYYVPDGTNDDLSDLDSYLFTTMADAEAYAKQMEKTYEGSDHVVHDAEKVGDMFLVQCSDHRVPIDDIAAIDADVSEQDLAKRVQKDVAAGDVYGVESLDDVQIVKTA